MISRLRARVGSLDLAAGAVLAILAVLVALTVIAGRAQGLRVQAGITDDGQVGPRGPLSLTFYDSVDQKKVEGLIRIIPPAAGRVPRPSNSSPTGRGSRAALTPCISMQAMQAVPRHIWPAALTGRFRCARP